ATATRTTEPGMGATRDPGATWLSGSGNRLTGSSESDPCGPSTTTRAGNPPGSVGEAYRATEYTVRIPSTTSTTSSGELASSSIVEPDSVKGSPRRRPSRVS